MPLDLKTLMDQHRTIRPGARIAAPQKTPPADDPAAAGAPAGPADDDAAAAAHAARLAAMERLKEKEQRELAAARRSEETGEMETLRAKVLADAAEIRTLHARIARLERALMQEKPGAMKKTGAPAPAWKTAAAARVRKSTAKKGANA